MYSLQKFLPLSWRQRKSVKWLTRIRAAYADGVRIRDESLSDYNRAYMNLRLARLAEIIQMAQDELDTYGVVGNLRRER